MESLSNIWDIETFIPVVTCSFFEPTEMFPCLLIALLRLESMVTLFVHFFPISCSFMKIFV